ncbi:MAG: HD domain-containing protein [Desulfobulbaceae bacterium]|nr:HD domain-containing protein [Desulfobulbaceae bacterium]
MSLFNLKFIRGLVLLAFLGLLLVPVYLFAYLSPALHDHVIRETQQEAVRVASHLSALLVKADQVSSASLPPDLPRMVSGIIQDFNLHKLKIFDASGLVIYSTNAEEIGTVNRNSYFHQEVAAGRNFSKLLQKEQFSLDGVRVNLDVVEAYVPIMRGGRFAGAFEIYYDVTSQLADLHKLVTGFYKVVLPVAAGLLLALIIAVLKFRDNFVKRLTTERKLKENEERYRNLFERSNDTILVCERDGTIQEVNEMACRMLGFDQTQLLGMKLWELVAEEEREVPVNFMAKLLERGELGLDTYVVKANGELLDVDIRVGVTSRRNGLLQAIIKDVSEQRKSAREVRRGYQTQTVLNKLLHLSLENLSLTETLELFIYYVTSFPWMVLEPKGAIFLIGDKPGVLELKAHRGLNESLQTICSQVPFGKCLCGRCALSGEIVFSDCMDHFHDNKYDGISQHGHYCVPIFSANRKLLGVFTLYIKHQAKREQLVEETLEAAASVIAGVIQRKRAEEELQKSRDRLEVRVQERTIDLEEANIQLGKELSERWATEKALAHANQEKDALIVNLFEIMYEMLANRDRSTFEHALRVAEISRRVGTDLQLPLEEMEALRLGCLVHDIGKVAIPDDVLLKPGLFDRMDRNIMQVHTLVGASLFAKHHHDNRIRRIILHHHERLDGSGYPYGIKGDEIGLLERIVAVADVFEALTARRPYKKPITRDKAMEILWYEVREGRLDENIVKIMERITTDWTPLEIVCEFRADYSEDLEVFRQMSYFREPLSDFYNYRYLLYLDDAKMLGNNGNPYHLILAIFPSIKEFNHDMGFIKADQVLDEIGQKLHQTSENFDSRYGPEGGAVMLLKKGSDFLIYTACSDELVVELLAEITGHLDAAGSEWGLDSESHHYRFESGFPADKALNQVFSGN